MFRCSGEANAACLRLVVTPRRFCSAHGVLLPVLDGQSPWQDIQKQEGVGMAEKLVDVTGLEAAMRRFVQDRGLEKSNSPKNLAMAVAGEAGELVALFQWLTEEQSRQIQPESEEGEKVQDELADVLIYLVCLAAKLGVDLDAAVSRKLDKNVRKYPPGDSAQSR